MKSKEFLKICCFQQHSLCQLKSIVCKRELEMTIHASNSLFNCLNKKKLNRLQPVQNSAAGLLTRTNRRAHISPF